MAYFLECRSGSLKGKRVQLRAGKAVTFGRDRASTARIHDRKLSRIHCQFEIVDGRVVLTDLSSTNGTYVNEEKVDERVIEVGDRVGLGRVELVLVHEDTPDEDDLEREAPTDTIEEVDEDAATEGAPEDELPDHICIECGADVSDDEIVAGEARQVADRVYCAKCVARFTPWPHRAEEEDLPDEPIKPGDEVAGNRVIQRIGGDPHTPLYLAEQSSGRRVALRVLLGGEGEWAQRYLERVYSSGQLVHSNILLILYGGEDKGMHYVCREYVEGRTLAQLLEASGRLPAERALGLAVQMAQALSEAHEHGIAHGRLAPRNALLTDEDVVKLMNFGLGNLAIPGRPTPAEDMSLLPYLAPESIRDEKPEFTFLADCYSLGAVLFHMLAGRPPFVGTDPARVQRMIRETPPPSPADYADGIPGAAARIVERCLAKNPSVRYPRPRDLLFELEETLR